MGVTGLLQCLKEIQEPVGLEKYRGKRLAIDTYGWLHRGLVSCAQELCLDLPTKKYISSIMKKVKMLEDFGVRPYFVFDGASLPTKAETANERRLRREEARRKAEEFQKKGNRKAAWKEFMKAACVTPEMAKSIMVELDKSGIEYVVAPYEADPQMVYLEKIGLVDGILSEDSDLLIFGCNRLITKLKDDATCVEICRENFHKVKSIPNLAQYTPEQLRLVAMLAGCDYTKGIPSIGLKTAFALVEKHNNLEKIILALKADGKTPPEDFMDEVYRADLAFQYQKVFNPLHLKLQTLNEYPTDFEVSFEVLESCCGETHSHEIHAKIASGTIHPRSHTLLVSREHGSPSIKSSSFSALSQNTSIKSISSAKETVNSVKMVTKSNSIDSYFHASSKTCVKNNKPANQKSSAVPSLSPASKKVKKMKEINDTQSSSGVSKFFNKSISEPNLVMTDRPSASKKDDVWDNSMLSGDSDIPDDFSSPLKKVSIFKRQSDENSVHASMISSSVTLTEKRQLVSNGLNTDKLASSPTKTFNLSDDDNDIEESPLKESQRKATGGDGNNLSRLATELRKNFSNSASSESISRSSTMDRKPLAPKSVNKRQLPEGADVKMSKKCAVQKQTSNRIANINTPTASVKLSKFSYKGSN